MRMRIYLHSKEGGTRCAYYIKQAGTIKWVWFNWRLSSAWREMEYQFVSVIRGHHVSKPFWTPVIDEVLTVIAEDGNRRDRFAVALSVPMEYYIRTR